MPQLDSLRAFAIGAVMLQHFHYPQLDRFVPFWLGVQLFFVLSGFLITGILVRGQPTAEFIGGFYLRRGLRLFPLYFLVVAIIAVFSRTSRRMALLHILWRHFLVAKNMQWGVATHVWTLGVEEQFYLLWPLVVLFTPRRLLAYLRVSLIPIALAFRVAMQVLHNDFGAVLLPGSVDSLACGALLAIAGPVIVTKKLAVLAVASLIFGCHHFFQPLWTISFALPLFVILVSGAAHGFNGMLGRILSQPLLQYIGRISYGIYVIHLPIIVMLGSYLSKWFPQSFRNTLVSAACTVVILGLAMLSWHFIESPINRRRNALWAGPPSSDFSGCALRRATLICFRAIATTAAGTPWRARTDSRWPRQPRNFPASTEACGQIKEMKQRELGRSEPRQPVTQDVNRTPHIDPW